MVRAQVIIIVVAAVVIASLLVFPPWLEVRKTKVHTRVYKESQPQPGFGTWNDTDIKLISHVEPVGHGLGPESFSTGGSEDFRKDTPLLMAECALTVAIAGLLVSLTAANRERAKPGPHSSAIDRS
jgi:hypothetical protein